MKTRRQFLRSTVLLSAVPFMVPDRMVFPLRSNSAAGLRVMSCNIRVALDTDVAKGVGWADRKAICCQVIASRKPDIICLQEVIRVQALDLEAYFKDYQLFGFAGPAMDAFREGYHGIAKNPILFRKDNFELQGSGTYWLSETPLIAGSKSWETARARHANWLRLRDRRTGQVFRVINLHLDHVSKAAKLQQLRMVVAEAAQYNKDFPQILAGDFNSRYNSEVLQEPRKTHWEEAYETVHGPGEAGFTGHEFEGENYVKGPQKGRIDFIWYRGSIHPTAAEIVRDAIGGKYPSDHFFMLSDFKWKL